MYVVKYILVIAHITTAAAWFGLALRLAGQARKVVAVSGEARTALTEDVGKSVSQVGLFILLTFIFGTANLVIAELWPGTAINYNIAQWPYHTSVTLLLVATGAHYAITRPAWLKVVQGDPAAAKRVAMGAGLSHLIWLTVLVLMYLPLMIPSLS
ncbi:MAG: hypothetical protein AAF624_02420 [Bacteroidota bacterium]